MDSLRGPCVKFGTIQRRLAWPLRKDDTHKSRSVINFCATAIYNQKTNKSNNNYNVHASCIYAFCVLVENPNSNKACHLGPCTPVFKQTTHSSWLAYLQFSVFREELQGGILEGVQLFNVSFEQFSVTFWADCWLEFWPGLRPGFDGREKLQIQCTVPPGLRKTFFTKKHQTTSKTLKPPKPLNFFIPF